MTDEAPSGLESRIRDLDALRGIAAMAVVLFHYTTRYEELYGHKTPPWLEVPWGHYGVQLFFGISGFVIFMTLDRTKSLLDFAVSRGSRLYPAYWAAIIITTAIVLLADLREFVRSPFEIAVNATMVQSFVGVLPVDGVYWTLSVELVFYCAMAALWSFRLLPRIEAVLLVWMSLTWMWTFTPALLGFAPSWLLGALLLQEYIPFFAIGIAAYRLKTGTGDGRWICAVISCALVTVTVCDGLAHLTVAMISTTALTTIALKRIPLLGSAPLVWLGTISYSLYLLHQVVGFAMLKRLEGIGMAATAAIGLTVAVMLVLAAAVTYFVEKPTLRAIRAYYKHRGQREGLAAIESS